MSFLREFRSPYGNEGGIASPSQEAFYKENDFDSVEIKHLKKIRDLIDKIELNSGAKEDELELEKRKNEVDNLISEVIKKAGEYKKTVLQLSKEHENLKKGTDKESIKDYQKENERLEKRRTASHNVLIDAVKKAVGYINYNFSDMRTDILDDWEEEQEKRGKIILDIKRIKFPKNVICPDNVELDDRISIREWAFKLTEVK